MESKYTKELHVILTDFQFHMCLPRKPLSPVRAIEKSLRNNKPGRWYSKNLPMPRKDGTIILPIFETDEMYKFIQKKKAEGIRVRVFMPKGLLAYAGKDTVEYIAAQQKKSFDRARR